MLLCLSSCSLGKADKATFFLNYKYTLVRAGDLHGIKPSAMEVISQNPGFTSYISLFSKTKSYINFQCKGTSVDDFYCETTFVLYDSGGNLIAGGEDLVFRTRYAGEQRGTIKYYDQEVENKLGTIYVYTPYWCRWQCEYDVDGSGQKTLITFEFWKNTYNPLPDWIKL